MPPEELPKFWQKIKYGEAEYVNGTRLIYPMDNDAMRFLNYLANKMFSILLVGFCHKDIQIPYVVLK